MVHSDTDQKIEQALHGGSDRYKETFSRLGEVIEAVFPTAQASFEYNLPGWKIERENVQEETKGTIDPRFVHVLIAERKAGLTLHLWNPADYYWLDKQKEALQGAGFKVMRGCVQFNRKQPFPFDTMESVLRTIAL